MRKGRPNKEENQKSKCISLTLPADVRIALDEYIKIHYVFNKSAFISFMIKEWLSKNNRKEQL